MNKRYTTEEDDAIRDNPENIAALAKILGRSRQGVYDRRRILMSGDRHIKRRMNERHLRMITTEAKVSIMVFARPAWFDEDLSRIARTRR